MTVTGEATVAVAPDTAVIRIGVSSQDKTAREASDANAKQMTAVLAAIKEPASPTATSRPRGCRCSRNTTRTRAAPPACSVSRSPIRSPSRSATSTSCRAVLDRAIAAGANEMSGIEFVVSEQSKLLDQARDDAIADARRKAELYAKAAGAKLGRVISISEEGAAPPPRPMRPCGPARFRSPPASRRCGRW